MATLELDKLDGAAFEQTGTIKRFIRTGIAYDLDTTSAFGTLYSVLSIGNCPRWGDTDTVSRDTMVTRIRVDPLSGDMARVTILYESFQGAGPASAYIITSRAFPRTIETNLIPGLRIPIKATYKFADTPSDEEAFFVDKDFGLITDLVPMRIYAPMRSYQISQLIYGSMTPQQPFNGSRSPIKLSGNVDKGEFICHVNSDTWKGKKPGFWLMNDYSTSESKYQGFYQAESSAITKVTEDWSETGILRNAQTGKFVPVDPKKIAAMNAKDYKYGMIYPTDAGNQDGIVRVGPYPTVSFSQLFGFK